MIECFRQEPPEAQKHKERDLPIELIYSLMAALGNGENKSLEFIVMRPEKVYSKSDLYREVMDHQDKDRSWKMSRNVPFAHCEWSFAPIGLVAKEALSPCGGWGYTIIPYGRETGIPFAGGVLKWSYEHPKLSLYQMLGTTPSSSTRGEKPIDKKRSPETRYKLLFEIATNPSSRITETDLAKAVGEKRTLITPHLLSLNKNKIITYQASERGKPYAYYRLKNNALLDKEPEPLKDRPILSSHVFEILKQNKGNYLSREGVAGLLIEKYPNYTTWKKQSLVRSANKVLSNLEKQGYLEREKFIGGQFQSEITLTDEQREAIVSLVEFLDKFQKGDRAAIREGGEFANRVAASPSLFSALMLKAKEASPSANATDRKTMEANILSILDESPNITTKEIIQRLKQKYDKEITYRSVSGHLRRLAKKGTIKAEKSKAGNTYEVTLPQATPFR